MFRLLLRTTSSGFRLHCNKNGTPDTPFLLYLHLKSLSTATTTTSSKPSLSAADYIATSLGVSPQSALEIGNKIDLTSVSNADSVVSLFKTYGFTPTHIVEIASKNRRLLSADPHKTLNPKLDFFARSGISGDALFHLVTNNATLLNLSLNKRLLPAIQFLRSFFGSTRALVSIFSLRRGSMILRFFSENSPPNLETLRRSGVPDEKIVKLMVLGANCLCHGPECFEKTVNEIVEMGFDPRSAMFVRGVFVLSSMTAEKRAAKVEVFRRFGWSEEQIQVAFVKNPMVFASSVERLERALGIFMKRLDWNANELAKAPNVLTFSAEKRVLPRLAVLETLISIGLEKKNRIRPALMMTGAMFLDKFVIKYRQKVPLVLELYKNSFV